MIKFSDLSLDPKVLKAISDSGYEEPTPIQAQGIPPALEGRDVLGIAQTGTGKTACFVLPMITRLGRGRARARMPRSLVLAPTRELATQVAENFDIYAKYTKLTKALLIGGVSFGEQDKLIDRGVDVLIATPGRLLDHFERGKLLLTGVQIMVVDEADRMLDMGFIPDIERIFGLTPFTRQTLFFSATMAPEIERITSAFLTAPARIEVARQATASLTIQQGLVRFKPSRKDRTFADKRDVLRKLITAEGEACTNAIIFCNRKVDVDVLTKSLKSHGFDAAPIHGDLDQSVRTRTLDGFRDGTIRLLIASDVAARGLDIPAVSHVFNFDVPSHPEDYIHRIGRTGRAGRLGKAITIASPSDEKYLAAITDLIKMDIPEMENPIALQEAPTAAAQDHDPEAGRSEKPARSRSRTTSRGSRSRGEREAKPVEAAAPSPEDTVVAEKAAPQPVAEAAPEPVQQHSAPQSRQPKPSARNNEQKQRAESRRDSNRQNDRHNDRVVGMGDHMPDFLTRMFHPSPDS